MWDVVGVALEDVPEQREREANDSNGEPDPFEPHLIALDFQILKIYSMSSRALAVTTQEDADVMILRMRTSSY